MTKMKSNQTIKIPRLKDTFTQEKKGEVFSFCYSYIRSNESRQENETGQDYLTFSESSSSFSFVLCDGVSQSFFGELAANILGDELLVWLNDQPLIMDKKFLSESLTTFLTQLTEKANSLVQSYVIGADTSAMLEEVLEEKRSMGSESMYICGRIDCESEDLPQGRMILSGTGDERIRIWNRKAEISRELGIETNIDQRWSTNRGIVRGEPSFVVKPLLNRKGKIIYKRILAYTDGFSLLDQETARLSTKKLDKMINESILLPENDDLSMIEIMIN